MPSKRKVEVVWSDTEREAILAEYIAGATLNELAAKYGVNFRTIRKVFTRAGMQILRRRFHYPRKYHFDTRYFQYIDSEEKAYWLGFLCADGYIATDRGYIQLGLMTSDGDHVRKFLSDVGATTVPLLLRSPSVLGMPGQTGCAVGVLYSMDMVEDLASHGVCYGCPYRTFPLDLSASLKRHYFRGLFDGDGGFHEASAAKGKDQWTMSICGSFSTVEAFASFAREVCGSNAKIDATPKIFCFTVHGNRGAMLLAESLYSDAVVSLDRKWETYLRMRSKHWPLRTSLTLTLDGKTLAVTEWAAIMNRPPESLYRRMNLGWTDEQVLSIPFRKSQRNPVPMQF